MKKVTKSLAILLAAAIAMPTAICAQDIYDDLYYSPSKAAKQKKQQKKQQTYNYTDVADYPSADSYTASSARPLNVDVDTYNRRNSPSQTQSASGMGDDDFAYTRRIQRYHNPDVVEASGDTALMEYYYNTPSQQDVNVYVINSVDPYPYYNFNAWSPFYNPYRYYSWGPSWSFGWGYDPWFDISWGWGNPWYPGWGPSWSWGPSWGWHPGHHHPWHPGHNPGIYPPVRPGHGWASNSVGAQHPHRPTYTGNSNRRPAYGTQGGNRYPSTTTRPGNSGRPSSNWGWSSYDRRGSNSNGSGVRPGSPSNNNNGNVTRPSNNGYRGNQGYRGSSSQPSRSSGSGYNGGSSSPSRGSGSYRGGSSYRSSGGGSYHGGSASSYRGGGGGRGRR